MSWVLRELAFGRDKPYEHASVESSELRDEIGLRWFLGAGDGQLSPKGLGAIIDDCLVEYISDLLLRFKHGKTDIEEFERKMCFLEEGMRDDPDLGAYAETIPVDPIWGNLKPTSETFLELARQHAVYGVRLPVAEEEAAACRFASAIPDRVMKKDWGKYDWDIQGYSRFCASKWLSDRNPHEILIYIYQSPWNPAAWDTLKLICEYAAKHGMGEILRLPDTILRWYLGANYGHPKRPGMARGPRNRRQAHGYKIRNNEIHHAVDLLGQAGVPIRTACYAVEQATHFAERYVRRICLKPYWTLEDIRLDIERRFTPPS